MTDSRHSGHDSVSLGVLTDYNSLVMLVDVNRYLLSSLVPSVGCSGSSNDLSSDSSRASFISDLK